MTEDQSNPRLIPAYALTGGRTKPTDGQDIPWEALITATPQGALALGRLRWEAKRIVALAHQPVSVAELAAALHLPIGVCRVLVADLVADGLLRVHRLDLTTARRPSPVILERLIAGLKAAV